MSYELEIQKSFPIFFKPFNVDRPPLVSGSGNSQLLTSTTPETSFGGWVKGREAYPFSIEIWALPLTVTGAEFLMIGHVSEGLYYDGSDYILRFEYTGAGLVEGRWSEPEIKAHHFVITYDTSSAFLYVDGERVISIDLPENDTFVRTSSQININQSNGTGIYDSLAYYYRVLSPLEIKEHYAWGRDVTSSPPIASAKGGTAWSLTYADVDIFQTISYAGDDWNLGYFTDVANSGKLEAELAGGTWQVAIPLGSMISPTTSGVQLRFVGEDVIMEWSTDAVTWAGIENKTTILEDATTTDLTLFIRLTLINEDSWVESLTADILSNRIMQPFSGVRKLEFKDVEMDHTPGHQLEFQSDMGAKIRNDGYIKILPDSTDTPTPLISVEMWVKYDEDANTVLVENPITNLRVRIENGIIRIGTGVTVNINGVPAVGGTTTVAVGQWNYFQVNFPTATNDELWIARGQNGSFPGDLTVYGLALYPVTPTGTYEANVGAPGLVVTDTGGFALAESAIPYDIYAYNWSIVSGSD